MVGVGSVGLSWCPGVVVNVVVGVVGLVRDSVIVDLSGILGVVGVVVGAQTDFVALIVAGVDTKADCSSRL